MHQPRSDPEDDPDHLATRLDELDGFLEEVRGEDGAGDAADGGASDAAPDRDGPGAGAAPGVGGFWGPGFEPAAEDVAWAEPPAPSGDGGPGDRGTVSASGPGSGSREDAEDADPEGSDLEGGDRDDAGQEDDGLGEMLEGLDPVDLSKA